MAKVTNIEILNPSTQTYVVCVGTGVIEDADDVLVTNNALFGMGSRYTNLATGKTYVRRAMTKVVQSWVEL